MTDTDVMTAQPDDGWTATPGRSRYPGAPPFGDSELDRSLFRGRDAEGRDVLHGILAERLFVLYGTSGTGKTSLLKAHVMHELRAREMWPVVVRLNRPERNAAEQVQSQIEEQVARRGQAGIELVLPTDTPTTLWDLFARLEIWDGNVLLMPVVIFDQFEELFTLDWPESHRQAVFDDIAAVVHGNRPQEVGSDGRSRAARPPHLKIVFALREDSLGQLEDVASHIPSILRHRFRLQPLSRKQASAGISEPAELDDPRLRTAPFSYTAAAVELILDFLTSEEAKQSARVASDRGLIEPSQLQLVCQHVEDVIIPTKDAGDRQRIEISADDLGDRDGLENILEQFYGRQLARFDDATVEIVRGLCEGGLISAARRRLSLEQDEIAHRFQVSETQLSELVERRLLRAEPRVGSVYYELAHDSLVEPILSYRDAQRREAERLRREADAAAEAAAAEQRRAERAEQERLQRERQRRLWIAAAIVGAVAIGAFAFFGGRAAGNNADVGAPAVVQREKLSMEVPAVGTISDTDDVVRYVFDGAVDDAVTIRVRSLGTLNPALSLGASGRPATSIDDTDPSAAEIITIIVAETGEQYIDVQSADGSRGEFEVLVRAERRIAVGESITGSIENVEQTDRYPFDGERGDAVVIEMTNDAASAGIVDLLGPDRVPLTGTAISSADGSSSVTYVLPSDGTFVLTVAAAPSATGSYELTLRETTALVPGTDTPGDLDGGADVAMFPFVGGAGDAVTVTATPGADLNLVLELLDPSGARLDRVDSAAAGASESITVILPVDGNYLAAVDSATQSTGAFTVRLDPTEIVEVDLGSADVSGSISAAAPTGVYRFSAAVGNIVTITMQPEPEFDAAFDVLDPGAVRFLGVSDFGPGEDETVSFRVREAGQFVVVAHGTGASTGAYEMRIQDEREQLGADPLPGTIERPGEVDVAEFTGSVGELVVISMTPIAEAERPTSDSIVDAQLALFASDGAAIEFVDDEFRGDPEIVIAVLPEGDTYFVNARGFADETGPYELQLQRITPTPLTVGESLTGSIAEPDEVDVFKLTTTAGGTRVDLTAQPPAGIENLDVALSLIGPNETFGVVEEINRNFGGSRETGLLTLRQAGDYYVVVRGPNGSTGEYTLSLSDLLVANIEYDTTLPGSLQSGTRPDAYEFFGAQGTEVTITVRPGATFDPALELLHADTGKPVSGSPEGNNNAFPGEAESMTLTLPDTGAYLVYVRGVDDSTGDYELTLS